MLARAQTDGDVVTALHGVLAAVSNGELSPDEGQAVAAIIESKRRALETTMLEERIASIERQLAERPR